MGKSEKIIDTKILVNKAALSFGDVATSLDYLCRTTLDVGKSMSSADAPKAWSEGKYLEVADYCLKDSQLTYDLYMYGKENGIVKSRKMDTGEIIEIMVEW